MKNLVILLVIAISFFSCTKENEKTQLCKKVKFEDFVSSISYKQVDEKFENLIEDPFDELKCHASEELSERFDNKVLIYLYFKINKNSWSKFIKKYGYEEDFKLRRLQIIITPTFNLQFSDNSSKCLKCLYEKDEPESIFLAEQLQIPEKIKFVVKTKIADIDSTEKIVYISDNIKTYGTLENIYINFNVHQSYYMYSGYKILFFNSDIITSPNTMLKNASCKYRVFNGGVVYAIGTVNYNDNRATNCVLLSCIDFTKDHSFYLELYDFVVDGQKYEDLDKVNNKILISYQNSEDAGDYRIVNSYESDMINGLKKYSFDIKYFGNPKTKSELDYDDFMVYSEYFNLRMTPDNIINNGDYWTVSYQLDQGSLKKKLIHIINCLGKPEGAGFKENNIHYLN